MDGYIPYTSSHRLGIPSSLISISYRETSRRNSIIGQQEMESGCISRSALLTAGKILCERNKSLVRIRRGHMNEMKNPPKESNKLTSTAMVEETSRSHIVNLYELVGFYLNGFHVIKIQQLREKRLLEISFRIPFMQSATPTVTPTPPTPQTPLLYPPVDNWYVVDTVAVKQIHCLELRHRRMLMKYQLLFAEELYLRVERGMLQLGTLRELHRNYSVEKIIIYGKNLITSRVSVVKSVLSDEVSDRSLIESLFSSELRQRRVSRIQSVSLLRHKPVADVVSSNQPTCLPKRRIHTLPNWVLRLGPYADGRGKARESVTRSCRSNIVSDRRVSSVSIADFADDLF